jgi:glycine/D-amino acid oxidase-like deaminating enzyme
MYDVVVVGAGIAGASLAYHAAARGARVLVAEREPVAGAHASGRNAALFYALVEPREVATLAARSRPFLLAPPPEVSEEPLFRATGSITLYGEDQRGALAQKLALAADLGLDAEILPEAEIARRAPGLRAAGAAALWCAGDGVLDIAAEVMGLLRGARRYGARVELGCEVLGLEVRGGRVVGVKTDRGTHSCAIVVDAAGAWAGKLGAFHGASRPPLVPRRRHLLFFAGRSSPGPFVVDARRPFYLRPESGGWLASPCDEDPQPAGVPAVDPVRVAEGMEAVAAHFPDLGARLVRSWACLRTRTSDERFVVGPDPFLAGYFWMAGLGGHGMTAGIAAGEAAAGLLLERLG